MTERPRSLGEEVLETSRSMFRFSWAMTMFGAQQTLNLVTRRGASPEAFDAVSGAIEDQFTDTLRGAFRFGDAVSRRATGGVPVHELNFKAQEIAMKPAVFSTMKAMMPPMVGSLSAMIPGRDADLARLEAENKMMIMQLVQDTTTLCPPPDVDVPLQDLVTKCYDLGEFPALWAVEGVGHYLVESRQHRGESLDYLLVGPELDDIRGGAWTMLHAGIGLSFGKIALSGLSPEGPEEDLREAVTGFVERCRNSSRPGYEGCALESLGLVAKHMYGGGMVRAVGRALRDVDEDALDFFWHGVGRAIYFSPQGMMPAISSPWPAVSATDELTDDDRARKNAVAGFAWGLTMVNLRHPHMITAFMRSHSELVHRDDAFTNGVCSALVMRHDTTPDEAYLVGFRNYRPDSPDIDNWKPLVGDPVAEALDGLYPHLKANSKVGEIFRYGALESS